MGQQNLYAYAHLDDSGLSSRFKGGESNKPLLFMN